jgi:hypothetical protein
MDPHATRAQLVVTSATIDGASVPIAASAFGYNANVSSGPGWTGAGGPPSTPTFIGQVAALRPQLLRYPGGTIANYWNWRTGLIFADWPGNSPALDVPNTLEAFKAAIDELATDGILAEPLWTVNMMTRGAYDATAGTTVCDDANVAMDCLDDQVAMLRHAESIGLPIHRVELGNEFYLSGREAYAVRFADGAAYARECRRWTARLRTEFPDVEVGIVGFARDDEGGTGAARADEWNQLVHDAYVGAPSNELPDGFILHFYAGTGLRLIPGYGSCTTQACTQEAFDSTSGLAAMMATPFSQASYYDSVASKIPGAASPWTTEFNLADALLVAAGTWSHGIFLALEEGLFTRRSAIACVHNISGASGRYSLIFRDAAQYEPFTGSPVTPVYGLTAAGYASSLFARAVQDATMRSDVAFSLNPTRGLTPTSQYNALTGWVFERADGTRRVFIVNASEESFDVNTDAIVHAPATLSQMSAEPHTRIVNSTDLTQLDSTLTDSAHLPAWSLTLIEESAPVFIDGGEPIDLSTPDRDATVSPDATAPIDASLASDASTDARVDAGVPAQPSAPGGCACDIVAPQSPIRFPLAALLGLLLIAWRSTRSSRSSVGAIAASPSASARGQSMSAWSARRSSCLSMRAICLLSCSIIASNGASSVRNDLGSSSERTRLLKVGAPPLGTRCPC